jgi:hypothetical protein
MNPVPSEFKNAMTEWVELKVHIKDARKDILVLSAREKALQKFIKQYMAEQEIDSVNVLQKRVNFKKKLAKGSITRDVIRKGLTQYFGANETAIEGAYQAILDAAPNVERQTLSLI